MTLVVMTDSREGLPAAATARCCGYLRLSLTAPGRLEPSNSAYLAIAEFQENFEKLARLTKEELYLPVPGQRFRCNCVRFHLEETMKQLNKTDFLKSDQMKTFVFLMKEKTDHIITAFHKTHTFEAPRHRGVTQLLQPQGPAAIPELLSTTSQAAACRKQAVMLSRQKHNGALRFATASSEQPEHCRDRSVRLRGPQSCPRLEPHRREPVRVSPREQGSLALPHGPSDLKQRTMTLPSIYAAPHISNIAELLTLLQQMKNSMTGDILTVETNASYRFAEEDRHALVSQLQLLAQTASCIQTEGLSQNYLLVQADNVNCIDTLFEGVELLKTNPDLKKFSVFFQKIERLKQSLIPSLAEEILTKSQQHKPQPLQCHHSPRALQGQGSCTGPPGREQAGAGIMRSCFF
ncbi:Interleukin-5-like protein [Aix galericulata]|nr:Interleukin-5-like protein [Aix galericulata]